MCWDKGLGLRNVKWKAVYFIALLPPPPPSGLQGAILACSRLVGHNATCTECKAFKQWQLLEYASLR